jgi:hypothetical protein
VGGEKVGHKAREGDGAGKWQPGRSWLLAQFIPIGQTDHIDRIKRDNRPDEIRRRLKVMSLDSDTALPCSLPRPIQAVGLGGGADRDGEGIGLGVVVGQSV